MYTAVCAVFFSSASSVLYFFPTRTTLMDFVYVQHRFVTTLNGGEVSSRAFSYLPFYVLNTQTQLFTNMFIMFGVNIVRYRAEI